MSEPSAIDTGRDGPESAALAGGWLVNIDGDEIVEMTRAQVVASFGSGRVHEHTLVWHEGMDDWLPLVQVPAFRLLALRESSIPESGARVKTRSNPPPKPLRRAVTEVGLSPPAPPVAAGSRPYGDSEGSSDSVTLSREALELLGRDVLEIAEREALAAQQTSDSVTVARALLEPNLDAPSEPRSADDTSVLAVYDRPIATIEFPKGADESTSAAKVDDDPTQMRAPIAPSAPPPAPTRKLTPVAFPPPAPQNPREPLARSPIPAPITTATPRSTMPALRQPEARHVPTTIRPAAGTPAVRANTPAPERRPPMRNPPPAPLDAHGTVAPAAPVPATRASVIPAAPARPSTPPPGQGPTPVAFAAHAPPLVAAPAPPPLVAAPAPPPLAAPPPPPAPPAPATVASVATAPTRVAIPTALAPTPTTALTAPTAPAFRAMSLPSLSELDAAALRGGRRVPLFWAIGGCLASAAIASIVTALVTGDPQRPAVAIAPVATAPVATSEPPKVTPLPPPAPVTPPGATVEPAPAASPDLAKAVAAQAAAEKPKKAPVAWKPRPKPKVESDSPYETPAADATAAPSPSWQGDPSGLEKPASSETSANTGGPAPASTFNPGF
jgi:hypothetical protein